MLAITFPKYYARSGLAPPTTINCLHLQTGPRCARAGIFVDDHHSAAPAHWLPAPLQIERNSRARALARGVPRRL